MGRARPPHPTATLASWDLLTPPRGPGTIPGYPAIVNVVSDWEGLIGSPTFRTHFQVDKVNILFVDSPVGTGYSYVDTVSALARTSRQTSLDLVELTRQVLDKYPLLRATPLYIFGESFGGSVAAEFALDLSQASSVAVSWGLLAPRRLSPWPGLDTLHLSALCCRKFEPAGSAPTLKGSSWGTRGSRAWTTWSRGPHTCITWSVARVTAWAHTASLRSADSPGLTIAVMLRGCWTAGAEPCSQRPRPECAPRPRKRDGRMRPACGPWPGPS